MDDTTATVETPVKDTKRANYLFLDLLMLYAIFCLLSVFVYKPVIGEASERLTSSYKSEDQALGDAIKSLAYVELIDSISAKESVPRNYYDECNPKVKADSVQDFLNIKADVRRCYFRHGVVHDTYSSGLRDAVAFYNGRMEFARLIKSLNVGLWIFDNEDTSPLSY